MNKSEKNTERQEFDKYIHAISVEIEHAQVKLISAANVQMLLHYWKIGHFILFNQKRLGWGSKFIERTSEALRKFHPEKKGYSPRNLKYMCQFAKLYPIGIVEQLILADRSIRRIDQFPYIHIRTCVRTTKWGCSIKLNEKKSNLVRKLRVSL